MRLISQLELVLRSNGPIIIEDEELYIFVCFLANTVHKITRLHLEIFQEEVGGEKPVIEFGGEKGRGGNMLYSNFPREQAYEIMNVTKIPR